MKGNSSDISHAVKDATYSMEFHVCSCSRHMASQHLQVMADRAHDRQGTAWHMELLRDKRREKRVEEQARHCVAQGQTGRQEKRRGEGEE